MANPFETEQVGVGSDAVLSNPFDSDSTQYGNPFDAETEAGEPMGMPTNPFEGEGVPEGASITKEPVRPPMPGDQVRLAIAESQEKERGFFGNIAESFKRGREDVSRMDEAD